VTDASADLVDTELGDEEVPPVSEQQWAVKLPGGDLALLWDTPWDVVVTTARELSTPRSRTEAAKVFPWSPLVLSPLANLSAAKTLYRTICKLNAQKPLDELSTRALYAMFGLVDDVEPPIADPESERAQQWRLELPGGDHVNLWDLPEKVVHRLADQHDWFWMNIVDEPLAGTGEVATAIYATVCKRAKVDPSEGLTAREFRALWTQVDDDKPTSFSEGLPVPKAGADRQTV